MFCHQGIHIVELILWTLGVLYFTASYCTVTSFLKSPWLDSGNAENFVSKVSLISYLESQWGILKRLALPP